MTKPSLDDLLKRMPEIAKAVNEFASPELQQKAFAALMHAAGFEGLVAQTGGSSDKPGIKSPSDNEFRGEQLRGKEGTVRHAKRAADTYKIVEINFRPQGKTPLKEFIEKKAPENDPEKYICICYYLEKTLEVSQVTFDHIYTAFKELRYKVPNIRQGLNNTRIRHGWVSYTGQGPVKLTRIGENEVEHELPRKTKTSR